MIAFIAGLMIGAVVGLFAAACCAAAGGADDMDRFYRHCASCPNRVKCWDGDTEVGPHGQMDQN